MAPSTQHAKSPEQPPGEYADAERNYQPRSLKFWSIILGMYLAIFLVALDRTIIATAIPAITDEFHSINDIGWYGSSYMLTSASFNPIFGRLYQLYSTKWTFLSSIVVFEVGSALCGAAPNSTAFIVGRAIAGLGSAGIFSGGMMIIIPLVPLRKRPMFTSIFGMTFGVSSVIAPIIGGAFTDSVTWRWCFYLNLPIGAFTIAATLLFFHAPPPQGIRGGIIAHIVHLDPLGAFFFIPSIVSLILALEWGGTTYAWSNPKVIGLLVTFAALFIIFVVVEALNSDKAMIPARVVLDRSIASAMIFIFLIAGAMISVVYYLNIWFQVVKGDSATRAGLSTLPMVISLVVISVFAAVITQKIGYYVPSMLVAPVFCSIGSGLLSTLAPNTNHRYWIAYQVLFGLGVGCGFQTSTLAAQTVLPRTDVPIGMSLMFFMQQLGGAILLAIDQNLLSTKLVVRLSRVAGLDTQKIMNTGATDLRNVVPSNELETVVNAYNYALTRIFVLTAGIAAAAIIGALTIEWRSIKANDPKPEAESTASELDKEKTHPSSEKAPENGSNAYQKLEV